MVHGLLTLRPYALEFMFQLSMLLVGLWFNWTNQLFQFLMFSFTLKFEHCQSLIILLMASQVFIRVIVSSLYRFDVIRRKQLVIYPIRQLFIIPALIAHTYRHDPKRGEVNLWPTLRPILQGNSIGLVTYGPPYVIFIDWGRQIYYFQTSLCLIYSKDRR